MMEAEQLADRDRPPAFLDVADAARTLDVSEGLVYRAVREGKMPHIRVGGRIRIPTQAFLELHGITADQLR
jgi:excisionase family DNA binding protein